MKPLFVAACLAALASPSAACPDWGARPSFGRIELAPGFRPDPRRLDATAGGDNDLGRCFPSGKGGHVARRPDVALDWAGPGRLTIAVEAEADAVLLIHAPDGRWHYSDDHRGTNPAISFDRAPGGSYDIWIGSYDGSRRNPAVLILTEYAE